MGADVGPGPGQPLPAHPAAVGDDGDALPAVVRQVLILLHEVLLIDVSPEARAEGFVAEEAGPLTLVVPGSNHVIHNHNTRLLDRLGGI